ncbi:hypothetical protein PENSPDRAFT_649934 [Peniophora sp. CONT]|nr:hypothetical protein PENSPDRAFT_649934 [Peniophora sp. CONT]
MSMIEPLTTTMLGKPAPILRRLRLRYIPGVDNTKTIDAELYGTHDYPLLQDVALHGLEFTIKTPFLSPTLRSLSLTHCRLFEHSDAQALHDLFSTMPFLEVLDLRDTTLANLAEPRRVSLPEHPLRLEYLRQLTLEAPYLTVYRFLDVIGFPTTAIVELSLENVTSASLKLGPPEKMLEFYRRHLGAASIGGAGYTRVGAHLDISPFDGQLSYAWTFSRPHHVSEGAVLPRSMNVKWSFGIRQHEEFTIMASFVDSVVELIPHTHTPHTLHFLQSGSFARWRRADEEPGDYDCWFEACKSSFKRGRTMVSGRCSTRRSLLVCKRSELWWMVWAVGLSGAEVARI